MWHASLSLQAAGSRLASPGGLERLAVTLLSPVGGDREWWFWNRPTRIAHLRVALTAEEYELVPPGCVTTDAGETGPERRRSRR